MTERKVAEVFPPGEFIAEELEARGWNQIDLSEIIGLPTSVISNIIMGKRAITPEIAKMLGNAFGTSAEYWMNIESVYQLSRAKEADAAIARRSRLYQIAPIKEMIKRHWIEGSENIDVLENRVKQFLGVKNVDDPIPLLAHAARRGTQEIMPSQIVWLLRAKQLAPNAYAKSFTEQSFENCLAQLKNLLHSTSEIRHVPRILADNGIRFLILEHLPQTRIDGVTFWLNSKSPVVVLTLRYDRIDAFWFTLAHELGHVKHKDGLNNAATIDTDLVEDEVGKSYTETEAEQQANYFATEFLVSHEELDDFILRVRPLFGRQKIMNFAHRIQVHPGIVIGQLHHRHEIPYSSLRLLLDRIRYIIVPSSLTDGWGQIPPVLTKKEASNGYKN